MENVQRMLDKYMETIFGSDTDEYEEKYSQVYKHELKEIGEDIVYIYKANLFEDGLELGILIKKSFTDTFGDTIKTNRDIYVQIGKELPNLLEEKIS